MRYMQTLQFTRPVFAMSGDGVVGTIRGRRNASTHRSQRHVNPRTPDPRFVHASLPSESRGCTPIHGPPNAHGCLGSFGDYFNKHVDSVSEVSMASMYCSHPTSDCPPQNVTLEQFDWFTSQHSHCQPISLHEVRVATFRTNQTSVEAHTSCNWDACGGEPERQRKSRQ